jgi:hypothetical protein
VRRRGARRRPGAGNNWRRFARADVVCVCRSTSLGNNDRVGVSLGCAGGVHSSSGGITRRNSRGLSRGGGDHSTGSRSHCSGSRGWTEGRKERNWRGLALVPVDVGNGENAVRNAGDWGVGAENASVCRSLSDELAVDAVSCGCVLNDGSESRCGTGLIAS